MYCVLSSLWRYVCAWIYTYIYLCYNFIWIFTYYSLYIHIHNIFKHNLHSLHMWFVTWRWERKWERDIRKCLPMGMRCEISTVNSFSFPFHSILVHQSRNLMGLTAHHFQDVLNEPHWSPQLDNNLWQTTSNFFPSLFKLPILQRVERFQNRCIIYASTSSINVSLTNTFLNFDIVFQ